MYDPAPPNNIRVAANVVSNPVCCPLAAKRAASAAARAASASAVLVVGGVGGDVVVQFGAEIVSLSVETVPPNAKARPVQVTLLSMVIPEAAMSVPAKVESAPSVVAAVGVHQTSQAEAPLASVTTELAEVVSAPSILNM